MPHYELAVLTPQPDGNKIRQVLDRIPADSPEKALDVCRVRWPGIDEFDISEVVTLAEREALEKAAATPAVPILPEERDFLTAMLREWMPGTTNGLAMAQSKGWKYVENFFTRTSGFLRAEEHQMAEAAITAKIPPPSTEPDEPTEAPPGDIEKLA